MTVGRIPSIEGGIQPTIVDAKGDLITAVAADTPARIAVGSNNTVLTADSTTATGLKWAALPSSAPTTASAGVTTSQSTTSATYTDLTTAGPAVTLTTGTSVLVIVGAFINPGFNATGYMGYEISGATTTAATDATAMRFTKGGNDTVNSQQSFASVVTVTAGSNTFTAKYRTTNTSPFANRQIFVMSLN
jgi:hypothetical protein